MSRAHSRRQIDVNKILIKVESSDEFYNKENEEGENVMGEKIGIGEIKKKATSTVEVVVDPNAMAAPAPKKQEIIIPVTKQLEDPLKAMPEFDDILHKKRKMQNHFIRINYCQPQPSPDIYEPTDEDLKFLKELNEKVPKGTKSSNEITLGNFAKTFEIWENVTDKNEIITLAKAQASVETLYSGPLKEFVPKIYEYWKNLRETYQRPLLRKFWRVVNKDENNPNAAFRARENPKMKTRRARGTNEQENTDKMRLLHQDIQMATVLLGNVRYREMLKMEMFDLAVMKFESSLKEKADHSSNLKMMEKFRESYENEAYLKIRNKMKEYNGDAQKLIDDFNAGNATIEEKPPAALKPTPKPIVTPVVNASEELNFDLGSFIATIIDESLNKDISPEAIRKLIDITVPVAMPEPDKVPSDLERQPSVNLKKMASMHEPLQQVLPSPSSLELPTKMNRTNSISIPQKHQPIKADQAVKPPQIPFEDKSLLKYTIRKRIGRQKRILLERIFEDEENSLFAHHKDYYMTTSPQKEILIAPEVAQKLPTPDLRQLYINRFEKFRDICPFNDSEEEADMTESTKMIKNLGSNFKNFMKQRRPVNPIM